MAFVRHLPQHRVDEASHAGSPDPAAEGDGSVDRGMGRNPPEKEELIGSKTEDLQEVGAHAAGSLLEVRGERRIEGITMAQYAGGDLVSEAAIHFRELGQRALTREVEGDSALQIVENAPGGGARGEAGSCHRP